MTKAYLKIPKAPRRYAPEINSRRMGFKHFITQNYKSDGDGGDDPEAVALLAKIGDKVKTEVEARGYKNEAEVNALINGALSGLNVVALRKFDETFDPIAIRKTVENMATQLEKIKNLPIDGVGATQKRAIKELLDGKNEAGVEHWKIIERAFHAKAGSIELNVRAAVVMSTSNVVTDGDIPEDILNSFSVEAFVPKRRPKEYIFNFINRRTVANITEYKTWLEEGDEQGAFAIVAEGGLKPLVSKTLVRNTSKYRKIAGKRVYTEEFAKFRREAYNIIEDLFNDQLLRNYAAILVTDLLSDAASYVSTALDGQYENVTDYHAIGAVAAQIEALDFVPDLLIMNPQDKWRIGLSQDSQGRFYTAVPMYTPTGEAQILGFRVITSSKMAVGNFILGESNLWKVEDEPVKVRMGFGINVTKDVNGFVTEVESDVDHNRFRIIAETFFHNWIATNHTGSFVYGNFADIKEILLAPAI